MSGNSKIEWTDATWNPVTGCSKVSQGCKHCYAEREWPRLSANPKTMYYGRQFTDVACHLERLSQPLRWQKPRMIFVNSMSDLFHEQVPDSFIDAVFAHMALAPQHVFQVLTKRPARMAAYLSALTDNREEAVGEQVRLISKGKHSGMLDWPLRNVWLGVSIEDQATADERIPLLLETPAAVRWISAEPLLGPVDLRWIDDGAAHREVPRNEWGPVDDEDSPPGLWWDVLTGKRTIMHGGARRFDEWERTDGAVDWVVVGAESGPKARPMHPEWARVLRDQCAAAGVPFLFKQWGEWGTVYERDGMSVFKQFPDFQTWVNKANTWVRGGICLDVTGRELKNGADMAEARARGMFPVTIMHRVGKKAAGRLLDGQLHDAYPKELP